MDHRFLILAVFGLGCAGAATLACSAPDPGAITFAEKRGGLEPGTSSGGPSSSSSSSSSSSTGGAGDGGTSSGGSGDPVFGTTMFAYQNPGQNANGANAAHNGSVEGKDCYMSGCHGPTGAVGPQWLVGGTVYNAATAGQTVAQAEIRVVDSGGKELAKTYTDANGNFWFDKGTGPAIPAGAKVGVRTAAKTMSMATTLGAGQGNCNTAGCHVKGTMQIFVN